MVSTGMGGHVPTTQAISASTVTGMGSVVLAERWWCSVAGQ